MTDQKMREQALDPRQSYIVQAPAGSGKTELLIQRFLRLLTVAKLPEEIIAITFTRKAAAEMRNRIVKALEEAQYQQSKPADHHKALTWTLAKAVIERNQQYEWQLEINSNRLRVLTIDALAHHIASQMPILTGFGASPSTVEAEEADLLHQKAVEALLGSGEYSDLIEQLLLHLDNKADSLQKLLIQMLKHREQWLPHIIGHRQNLNGVKKDLESALEVAVLDILKSAQLSLEKNNLELPPIAIEAISEWKTMVDQLLTKEGQWRKRQRLVTEPTEELREILNEIKNFPSVKYNDEQWMLIQALVFLLPLLVAQLNVIFQEHEVVDFIEVTLAALRALGDENQPSDYALQLDTQIRHLLIDEFQDTSIIQFRLIEKLIVGWQPNEGRTLFLVGDPMQSIYRFRQVEVGLFLKAKNEGIGEIQLMSVTLCNNFRSQANLVKWFNQTFESIFPEKANSDIGAIPYTPSIATQSPGEFNVNFYSFVNANTAEEAQQIVSIIQSCYQKNPHAKIAVLVRLRSHLQEITPALRKAAIPFQAVEIENFAKRTEIQDLLSLTRALHHLGDRIAWLSILHAPWCGLTLRDLHALSQYTDGKPLWVAIKNASEIEALTSDGRDRIARFFSVLSDGLCNRERLPLAMWIEGVWSALGGPACLNDPTELTNVRTYFQLLETIENEFTFDRLMKKLGRLYVQIDKLEANSVQVMTIHKAKGLEFDCVILPSLERIPKREDDRFLRWLERPTTPRGVGHLILAPLKPASKHADPIYDYVKRIEKKKADNEIIRLLYVAATRAKEELHLLMKLNQKETDKSLKLPTQNSFARILWSACQLEIKNSLVVFDEKKAPTFEQKPKKLLRRLSNERHYPET